MEKRTCDQCYIDLTAVRNSLEHSIKEDEKRRIQMERLYKINLATALIVGLTVGISIGRVWLR